MTEQNKLTESSAMKNQNDAESESRIIPMVECFLRKYLEDKPESETIIDLCKQLLQSGEDGSVCIELTDEQCELLRGVPFILETLEGNGLFILYKNRLYTRRNRQYEHAIAEKIKSMIRLGTVKSQLPDFSKLSGPNEGQQKAIEMLCRESFSILIGGPGTGKTYTIAQAMKLLLEQERNGKDRKMRIALAAPTGKAAARVKESMDKALAEFKKEHPDLQLPEAKTIHSLLETNYDFVSFKRNRTNPLELDWLIVDESSMIDMPVMAKLLDALPENCRLTLVGDANQLASVEKGRIFGDLCKVGKIPKCELTESRRFPAGGEVATLADAVNTGNFKSVKTLLECSVETQERKKVIYHNIDGKKDMPHEFFTLVKELFRAFSTAETPEKALSCINECRILSAIRSGKFGLNNLNRMVQNLLGDRSPIPVMITANNRSLGVSNGDIGVIMPDEPDKLYLPESGGNNVLRGVPLALLPTRETAFVSTIHKSQGAEFKTVVIILPPDIPDDSRISGLLTREILYTAITRTEADIHLFTGSDTLKMCCTNKIHRCSGLQFEFEE